MTAITVQPEVASDTPPPNAAQRKFGLLIRLAPSGFELLKSEHDDFASAEVAAKEAGRGDGYGMRIISFREMTVLS